MARPLLALVCAALVAPGSALGYVCRYPVQRLTGLANLTEGGEGAQFVKLDLTVKLLGPECDVIFFRGALKCQRVRSRTFRDEFIPAARGRCRGVGGRVLASSSYSPRNGEPAVADVVVETQRAGGGTCVISGVTVSVLSIAPALNVPLPALVGQINCQTASGAPVATGVVQLLRLPLPQAE